MSHDQDQKVKELFFAVLDQPEEARERFLAQASQCEPALKEEVLNLLRSYEEAEEFLEKPVANLAAQLIKEDKINSSVTGRDNFLTQLPGSILDNKYQIEELLGQGGMGAVYRAMHLGTKRPVALKVIAPQFMVYAEFVERFKREAEAAGRLSHPNVVNVTDFGIANVTNSRVAYLVMEYLRGCTLGEVIKRRGALPVGFTIDVIEQVCFAVDEAHKQGIIHRDLKPENIWLEPNGRGGYHVKVLDFGLAKLHSLGSAQSGSDDINRAGTAGIGGLLESDNPTLLPPPDVRFSQPTRIQLSGDFSENRTSINEQRDSAGTLEPATVPEWLTRVGMVLGTPLYMSPEQCHGKELDARADIYSIGIIIYEMLAGETPFRGDFYELVQKHTEMPPPNLRAKRKGIPVEIAELVMSALAKHPSERPARARALAISLRTFTAGEGPLLRSAFELYSNNIVPCLVLSAGSNLFFVVLGLLLTVAMAKTSIDPSYNTLLELLRWPMIILTMFISGEVNTAIFAYAMERARAQNSTRIHLTGVFDRVKRGLPALLITIVKSYIVALLQGWKLLYPAFKTHIQFSFTGSIVFCEAEKGNNAMKRSKALLTNFYSLAFSLKLRSMLIRLLASATFVLTFFFTDDLLHWQDMGMLARTGAAIVVALLIPGLLITIFTPLVDMAMAALYLKSREAQGEQFSSVKLNKEEIEIAESLKLYWRRKAVLAISMIIVMLFSTLSFYLVIPPLGKIEPISKPTFVRVPDEENAWIEYSQALKETIDFNTTPLILSRVSEDETLTELFIKRSHEVNDSELFKNLANASFGIQELSPEQRAYINNHQAVIKHLLLATKRPKAQYLTELPNLKTRPPTLIQVRAVTNIAIAQARISYLEGRKREAAEIALAAYRMGTDVAEPYSTLITNYIAVVSRGNAAGSLFTIINSGGADAETDLMIARKVAELDRQFPTPLQITQWEALSNDISMEDMLVYKKDLFAFSATKEPGLGMRILASLPGLRLRNFQKYQQESQKKSPAIYARLENWDFIGLGKLANSPSNSNIPLFFFLETNFANVGLSAMKNQYLDRSRGIALQVFAAALWYQKTHGHFPETLAQLMTAAGMEVPVDPATARPVGYRLENGKPIIWLAGVDGKDDGGKDSYIHNDKSYPTPGKDIILRLGELPFFYNPRYNN